MYLVEVGGTDHVPLVERGVGEEFGGDGADDLAAALHAQLPVASDAPDHCSDQTVALCESEYSLRFFRLDDGEHSFLGLGDHDLVRLHPALPQRDPVGLYLDADAALRGHLGGRGGYAGRSEVLERD